MWCLFFLFSHHAHHLNTSSQSSILLIEFVNYSRLIWIRLAYVLCTLCYCLEWNLLLEKSAHINKWSEFSLQFLYQVYYTKCREWIADDSHTPNNQHRTELVSVIVCITELSWWEVTNDLSLEDFVVIGFNKICLGRQPHQGIKVLQCSRNWLSPSSGCYYWLG